MRCATARALINSLIVLGRFERSQPPQHGKIRDTEDDGDIVVAVSDGRADGGRVPNTRRRGSPRTAPSVFRMAPLPMKPIPVRRPCQTRDSASADGPNELRAAIRKPHVEIATRVNVRKPALRSFCSRSHAIGSASTKATASLTRWVAVSARISIVSVPLDCARLLEQLIMSKPPHVGGSSLDTANVASVSGGLHQPAGVSHRGSAGNAERRNSLCVLRCTPDQLAVWLVDSARGDILSERALLSIPSTGSSSLKTDLGVASGHDSADSLATLDSAALPQHRASCIIPTAARSISRCGTRIASRTPASRRRWAAKGMRSTTPLLCRTPKSGPGSTQAETSGGDRVQAALPGIRESAHTANDAKRSPTFCRRGCDFTPASHQRCDSHAVHQYRRGDDG